MFFLAFFISIMKLFKFKKILYKDYVNSLQDKLNHVNDVINKTNQTIEDTKIIIDNKIIEQISIEEKNILENALIEIEKQPSSKQKV
jgi:TRAP-type C4-dicarboxylate transport system substrate-binding protein